jgi:hypothetical protein
MIHSAWNDVSVDRQPNTIHELQVDDGLAGNVMLQPAVSIFGPNIFTVS